MLATVEIEADARRALEACAEEQAERQAWDATLDDEAGR
jgi:hypothetical protein